MLASEGSSNPKKLQRVAIIRRNHDASGGAELYTDRLIRGMKAAGLEVHLFSEAWPETAATFHRIDAEASRAEKPWKFARAVQVAIEKEGPFDAVFSLERTVRQDVYRAGDGVHRCWLDRQSKFLPWWKKLVAGKSKFHRAVLELESESLNPEHTGRIIVNSEMVRQEILSHFPFPQDRIHLVRNGIDLDRFEYSAEARERARRKFGLNPDEYVLAFVGSGWERKGLRFAVEAFNILNDTGSMKFLVAGRGKMRFPAGVIPLGPIREVEEVYFAADLFVFPTVYDPSANVCFEALAAGLPVVTTRANGASELIKQGVNGLVLNSPDDSLALLAAICFWRDNHPGRISREGLPDLSIERNVQETLAVLQLGT